MAGLIGQLSELPVSDRAITSAVFGIPSLILSAMNGIELLWEEAQNNQRTFTEGPGMDPSPIKPLEYEEDKELSQKKSESQLWQV